MSMAGRAHSQLTAAEIAKMCELKEKHGLNVPTIATRFGLSQSTVREAIKAARPDLIGTPR